MKSSRHHPDRPRNRHRHAHLLTHATANTPLGIHLQLEGRKVQMKRLSRAFGHASLTSLVGRTQPGRHFCQPHTDGLAFMDRKQGFRSATLHTRKIITQKTRTIVRKDDRSVVSLKGFDAVMRAGINTIPTLSASFQKKRFCGGTRWAQPIRSYRDRSVFLGFRRGIPMLDEFLNRHPKRYGRMTEKTSPPIPGGIIGFMFVGRLRHHTSFVPAVMTRRRPDNSKEQRRRFGNSSHVRWYHILVRVVPTPRPQLEAYRPLHSDHRPHTPHPTLDDFL